MLDEVIKHFNTNKLTYYGKSSQELHDYMDQLDSACCLFGVPHAFIELLTCTDMDKIFDQSLNIKLYNLLMQTTDGQARRVVRRHHNTKDGRAALQELQHSVAPPVSSSRISPQKAAINFVMTADQDPEEQLNKLDRLIEDIENLKGVVLPDQDVFDLYVNALESVKGDIYGRVLDKLDTASTRGTIVSTASIKVEAVTAWQRAGGAARTSPAARALPPQSRTSRVRTVRRPSRPPPAPRLPPPPSTPEARTAPPSLDRLDPGAPAGRARQLASRTIYTGPTSARW